MRFSLRVASSLAAVLLLLLLPLELRWIPGPALAAYGVVTLAALGAAFAPLDERTLDVTCVTLGAAYLGGLLLHLALAPDFPGLVSNLVTLLLLGWPFLFAWDVRRVTTFGLVGLTGFVAVGALRAPAVPASPSFELAAATLGIGVVIAIAGTRIFVRARSDLGRREAELASLSNRLMALQEDERRRLSRDLHDGVGQSVTAILASLWLIERHLPAESSDLRERTAEARKLASATMADLRQLSQRLRPPALDDYGLVPSIETQLSAFETRHRITTTFATEGLPERLPAPIETALYRITQEALDSVAAHACATHVRVVLGAAPGALTLEVEDDVGRRAGDGNGGLGLGLVGIRERARALGGSVTIGSGHGPWLRVRLPIAH